MLRFITALSHYITQVQSHLDVLHETETAVSIDTETSIGKEKMNIVYRMSCLELASVKVTLISDHACEKQNECFTFCMQPY